MAQRVANSRNCVTFVKLAVVYALLAIVWCRTEPSTSSLAEYGSNIQKSKDRQRRGLDDLLDVSDSNLKRAVETAIYVVRPIGFGGEEQIAAVQEK